MVDSESYVAQEKELHKRLPTVSLEVIRHFLTRYHGNVEECYQKLRVLTPQPLSPEMEPFRFYERTSTVSTSRPTQYDQYDPHHPPPPSSSSSSYLPQRQPQYRHHEPQSYQHGMYVEPPQPQTALSSSEHHHHQHQHHFQQHNDHRMVKRQLTWEPPYVHTLPNPRRTHTAVHQPPLDHQFSHINQGASGQPCHGGYGHPSTHRAWNNYATNDAQSGFNNLSLPAAAWPHASLPRYTHTASSQTNSGSINPGVGVGSNLLMAQQRQLDDLHRYNERQITHLTLLKQQVDDREQSLSRLRMQVSAIPSQNQMGDLKDVIQTLEIDLREARNSLQVQQLQRKMKEEQDIYTDEGERWYCEECNFLNHPLMTLCEKCDIPRASR